MKIAINATSAVSGGGVTYIRNLLDYLSKMNTTHQYLILTTVAGREKFYIQHGNFKFLSFKMPSKNTTLRVLWEQFVLPIFLKKEKVDILFSPGNICPIFSWVPNVLMIQNLAPFNKDIIKAERGIRKFRLKLLKILTVMSIKRSKEIIFISKKAISDVKKTGISLKHVSLIYLGKDENLFYENIDADWKRQIMNKYKLDKFVLYVSNMHRYKNFFGLVKAFSKICDKIDKEIKLILVGRCFDTEYYKEMMIFIRDRGMKERVLFLGEIPYEELPCIYSSCMLFMYPSLCENCPNILIEAMACGAAILASNIEPIQEICADAALYFDPNDSIEISNKILEAIKDNNLLSILREKATARAKRFSWESTVVDTLKIFERFTKPCNGTQVNVDKHR